MRMSFGRLALGTSVLAMGALLAAAPAAAQDANNDEQGAASGAQGADTTTSKTDDGTIVVSGVRQALQSAQQRKKNADTVIDSISATDIGAFPDKSVAEALQRVPGISVSRFAINTDTAHFTTEPSGVLVRGLPQVRNEFNGRDTFSANGGRALSWGDVPAELLGGIDVYKNQTSDLIEGGIAGTVNLRTRLPFDVNGETLEIGVKANYGDIGKKVTPDANFYYSNRWQTGIGEIGIMADVAYSQVKTGSQGLQSYRGGIFTGGMIPGSANATSVFGPGTVVIPSSLSFLDDRFDRKRTGVAAAAQWESNDGKWQATTQYIRSLYRNSMEEHGVGVGLFGFPGGSVATFRFQPGASGIPQPAPGTPDFTFDENGFMDHGTFVQTGGWWGNPFGPGGDASMAENDSGQAMIHSCYGWSGQSAAYCPAGYDVHGDNLNTASRIQQSRSLTQEAAFNLKYEATDTLHFSFDGQYVDSATRFYDASMGLSSFTNPELSGLGTKPRIVSLNAPANIFLSPGGYENPNNWYINNLADQIQNSKGHEAAFRADGQWDIPDSWVDTLKFGARYSDREQLVRNSDYNWNSISNTWTNGCQYVYFNLDSPANNSCAGTDFKGYPPGFYDIEGFGAPYFGRPVGNFPFVPFDFLNRHGMDQFAGNRIGVGTYLPQCDRYDAVTNGTTPPGYFGAQDVLPDSCFAAHEIADISEKTKAAYVMAKFGGNDNIMLGSVKVSGNIGVRFVETEDRSNGYTVYPTISVNPATACPPTPLVPGGLTGNAPPPPPPQAGQPPQVAYSAVCYLPAEDVAFASGGSGTPSSSTNKFHHWLPSFNLRFDFSPSWLLRFAASKAMSRPDIGLLKNYLKVTQELPTSDPNDPLWVKDAQGNVVGAKPRYLGTATNPKLKPTTAWQFDLSLENYFGHAGMFSLDVFYKSFQNYIQSGLFNTDITNNGVTRTVQVNGPANGKGAKIYGLEVAYNRFFDFLPKPLDGLGIQTNFTYLKNKGVPNANLQTFFGNASPVVTPPLNPGTLEGLSKYSFNVVGLYETPDLPVSFRLAYNWRSKYLITASDCCVGLPVWNAAAGYLDGSIRYKVNDNLEFSVEGSNLLNTQTVTLQQLTDLTSPEGKIYLAHNSWFRQDRRVTFGVRWKM